MGLEKSRVGLEGGRFREERGRIKVKVKGRLGLSQGWFEVRVRIE